MANVDLIDILGWSAGDGRQLIERLIAWGALPKEGTQLCPAGHTLLLRCHLDKNETQWVWNCARMYRLPKKGKEKCRVRNSIRTGTVFHKARQSYQQLVTFVLCWTLNASDAMMKAATRMT